MKASTHTLRDRAEIEGLKAKRDYLSRNLASLREREDDMANLKARIKATSQFSTGFQAELVG